MEKEAVQIFLEETRRAGLRFEKLGEVLEEEKQRAYKGRSVSFRERVQENRVHEVTDDVERIEAAKRAYLEAYLEMCSMQGKALDLVQLDEHALRQAVLWDRFLNRRSWDDIAKAMELSPRHVMRLAKEAYKVIGNSSQAAGILGRP